MPAPKTSDAFVQLLHKSRLLEPERLDAFLASYGSPPVLPEKPIDLARRLGRLGLLTPFQCSNLLRGKWRGFYIGKYRLLEPLRSGGMSHVLLCEHPAMRRLAAIKVLPPAQFRDASTLPRFFREARAIATFDHPNIIQAHDIDRDGDMPFLVMEYVDGSNLQEVVEKHGPLAVARALNYTVQVAQGLQHAHSAGWAHRDVKPANLLLDRHGVVKILDLGLARLLRDPAERITEKYDPNSVIGSPDFLAPEQARDGQDVDSRADIYGLGATLYFLLTGQVPFPEGTLAHKLLAHQLQEPRRICSLRPEISEDVERIVKRMMAKHPDQRYQTAGEVVEALQPWLLTPIELPPPEEMPRLCPAVQALLDRKPPQVPAPARKRPPTTRAAAVTQTRPAPLQAVPTSRASGPADAGPVPEVVRAPTPPRPRGRRRKWGGLMTAVVLILVTTGAGLLYWTVLHAGSTLPAIPRPPGPAPALEDPSPPASEQSSETAIPPALAAARVGQVCLVEMEVKSTGSTVTPPRFFLNSEADYRQPANFTIVLGPEAVTQFRKEMIADLATHFHGRRIRVRGTVTLHRDRPQIVVQEVQALHLSSN